MSKHKHHDLIVKWAETACEVEYWDAILGKWKAIAHPSWIEKLQYRLVLPKKYRWVMQHNQDKELLFITNTHFATPMDAEASFKEYTAINRIDATEKEG